MILLDAVLKTIRSENLLEETSKSGTVLLDGLTDLQNRFPGYLNSARGRGTFCAINCDTTDRRDKVNLINSTYFLSSNLYIYINTTYFFLILAKHLTNII